MARRPQSFENHAMMVPAFHYFTSPVLIFCVGYFGYRAVTEPSADSVVALVFGIAVFMVALFARLFALGVQDRVIRLEERLRMERILPPEMRARIGELSTRQLIALRFASDAELPELTARVLSGELTEGRAIKAEVREWRADHQRV